MRTPGPLGSSHCALRRRRNGVGRSSSEGSRAAASTPRSRLSTSPFLDLRALLVLPDWIYALRVFGDAGDASGLARLIDDGGDQVARALAKELGEISEAREAGLPLELGQASARFRAERRKPFRKAIAARGALLDEELWRCLDEELARFAFSGQFSAQGWKKQVELNSSELTRQAALVDDLLGRGSIAVALGLMNEWTVSRALLQMGRQQSWLDYHSARRAAATALGSLATLAQDQDLGTSLTDAQRSLGRFWRDLSDLRNAFHHHRARAWVHPQGQRARAG
ncbi:MAG TPA: TM1812 family CRISPR-associated protein [Candidatus Binatia bacterium]|nr:TM1812 family CRISPR-associated protein [Candidatus Binatia bacterium]